jgi:hypothetical protein
MKFSVSLCFPLKVSGFSYLIVFDSVDEVYGYYYKVPGPASAIGYYMYMSEYELGSTSSTGSSLILLSIDKQLEVVVPLDAEPKYSSSSCIASFCSVVLRYG